MRSQDDGAPPSDAPTADRAPLFAGLPRWFWFALAVGLLVRLYLVLFTQGTYDVGKTEGHALGVLRLGLIGCYHASREMNHPPFMGLVFAATLRCAQATGIPFAILHRLPFALLDGGTLALLLALLRAHRGLVIAFFWLNPIAFVLSSYHGNTDSAVAFFVLLGLWLLSRARWRWAAAMLGLALWVKLPALLALPALVLFVPRWRERLHFLVLVAVVGAASYLPWLMRDAPIIFNNVLSYRGQLLHTTAGIPVWGNVAQFLLPLLARTPLAWQARIWPSLAFFLREGPRIALVLIVVLSWLRRSPATVARTGLTIAAAYTVLYGFSSYWSFQYLAWSIPFWLFAPRVFLCGATLTAGGYVYGLYWYLCGNPWLLGPWDFVGRPRWPWIVVTLRNLAILFFFIAACAFLAGAVRGAIRSSVAKETR